MRKTLLYTAILLTFASVLLALANFARYKRLILKQAALIEEQRKDSTDFENDFKKLQEKVDAATSHEEASKKEALAAKEAQAQAESELANVQQQLAAKDAELTQLKGGQIALPSSELSKPASVTPDKKSQEKNISPEKKSSLPSPEAKNKEANTETTSSHLEGKVLAVNATWSFVVINLGEQNGITNNREFLIKRGDQVIAKVKVTSVEPSTAVADVEPNNAAPKNPVQVGDVVVEAPAEGSNQ
ncbi:MAG: hypothetical protein K2W99_08480 [Chthoniobacterales bacterium]|nr:hypothetical protein [Chthoniobacterales bacterium]